MKLDTSKLDIVNFKQQRTTVNKSFNEAEHPRDKAGKFTKKGAGQSGDSRRNQSGANEGIGDRKVEGTGNDGRTDSGLSRRIRALSEKSYKATSEADYNYHLVSGKGASEAYSEAVSDAKRGNKFGAMVDAYEPHKYEGTKRILSEGGEAGVAVKPSGDIVSVFHNKNIKKPGKKAVVPSLLSLAIQNGGDRLDCYDAGLTEMYANMGFVPVARMKFDRQYAPEGWNYDLMGEPDVVFMAHNGDDIETVMNTKYPMPDMSSVPYIDDYDKGADYQNAHIEKNSKDAITKSMKDLREFMSWKTEEIS